MNAQVIAPDYQWKTAASQEGVDYDAVQKSFMDQSYGVVANKAKILFQDPFRLGFEIVHRNEKATKMVGIFAFRVNTDLLYAPTFFVNGEIKAADMLYRADVKRFVPLTEDWCAYLARGVNESAGAPIDKGRIRQADAYMDRLAYPQRVKYASEMDFEEVLEHVGAMVKEATERWHEAERADNTSDLAGQRQERGLIKSASQAVAREMPDGWVEDMEAARDAFVKVAADGSLWKDIMAHCADNTPLRKLLPDVINETGPESLEKLASLLEDQPEAERFLVENYTTEELETVDGWMAKEAAEIDPHEGCILINLDPGMAKSASAREGIFDCGYELIDKRAAESLNTVIEESGDGTVKALSGPCAAEVLTDGGQLVKACLFRQDSNMLHDPDVPMGGCESSYDTKANCIYFPEGKEFYRLSYDQEVFGDELVEQDILEGCKACALQQGKCYVMFCKDTGTISEIFMVAGKSKDGDSTVIETCNSWGDKSKLFYAANRSDAQGRYISDESCFLEVNADIEKTEPAPGDPVAVRRLEPVCDTVLMSSAGIDEWIRTAGGITTSNEVTVTPKTDCTFDVKHTVDGTIIKEARDLGMLEAHLKVAEDFSLHVDKAGEIISKAVDGDVTYRVFDSMTKAGFMTRQEGMEDWIQSFDPELNVRLDAPQQQILSTHTPRRQDQISRYGDTHQRRPAENSDEGEDHLPMDAVLSQSPEELARLSQQYDMPHIFDHGCLGQMATNSYNIVEQIKQYVPDLEAGVDRYFRILFLLRYRPADFEEIYGKDALVELEQDLAELASRAGENLLRMLQRFDTEQYSAQDN